MEQPTITIHLDRLTAADLRTATVALSGTGAERTIANLDMLERAVDGGLEAIPLPQISAYVEALNTAITEMFVPKP